MLELGTDNLITFGLALSGTTQTPTVRVVLEAGITTMYEAKRTEDGKYAVNIKLPQETEPGSYDFCVEVQVGGRIFTPLKNKIEVGKIEVTISDFSFGESIKVAPAKPVIKEPEEPVKREPKKAVEKPAPKVEKPASTEKKPAPDSKVGDLLLKIFKEQNSPSAKPVVKPAPALIKEEKAAEPVQASAAEEISFRDQMQILAGIKPMPKRAP